MSRSAERLDQRSERNAVVPESKTYGARREKLETSELQKNRFTARMRIHDRIQELGARFIAGLPRARLAEDLSGRRRKCDVGREREGGREEGEPR